MNEEFEAVVEASSLHPADKRKLINLFRLMGKQYWTMTHEERVATRLSSGLSRGQACKLLAMDYATLELLETARDLTKFFSPAQMTRVDEVFGTGHTTERGGGK